MAIGRWNKTEEANTIKYSCGYCGVITAPSQMYYTSSSGRETMSSIYICSNCNRPTFISYLGDQVPGPLIGREVKHLPELIKGLYEEARKCISVGANTSSVLACRKLLMNIAVHGGAAEDKTFQFYVTYLEDNNYIPPNGRAWVDKIRQKGNEATHEIAPMTLQDATELITFVEMLLIFVFEFPGMVAQNP